MHIASVCAWYLFICLRQTSAVRFRCFFSSFLLLPNTPNKRAISDGKNISVCPGIYVVIISLFVRFFFVKLAIASVYGKWSFVWGQIVHHAQTHTQYTQTIDFIAEFKVLCLSSLVPSDRVLLCMDGVQKVKRDRSKGKIMSIHAHRSHKSNDCRWAANFTALQIVCPSQKSIV